MRDYKKPMFAKRHYEVVANALFEAREKGYDARTMMVVSEALMKRFEQDNPGFDRAKFINFSCLGHY